MDHGELNTIWDWCWANPRCLAFPVASLAGLAAIARRVDPAGIRSRKERGLFAVSRSCFSGAIVAGISAFALEIGIGSLWDTRLEVVTMCNLLAAVAIDWSAESLSGSIRTWLLMILEAYLAKIGWRLERTQPGQSRRSAMPDDSRRSPPP